jgi:energy-coupling factor transporter transmembrane protein EcfT
MTLSRKLAVIHWNSRISDSLGAVAYLAIFVCSLAAVMLTPFQRLHWVAASCFVIALLVYPQAFLKLLRVRFLILIVILATPPIFLLGQIDHSLAGIRYSSEGLMASIQITLRILVVLVSIQGLTSRIDIASVAGLLERIGLRGLGFSMGVALNLLPTLQHSATNAWRSMWMRGGFRKNRWRGLRLLAVTIIAGALGRAEEIALAAEARAFSPQRARYMPVKVGKYDWGIALVLSIAVIGLIL